MLFNGEEVLITDEFCMSLTVQCTTEKSENTDLCYGLYQMIKCPGNLLHET